MCLFGEADHAGVAGRKVLQGLIGVDRRIGRRSRHAAEQAGARHVRCIEDQGEAVFVAEGPHCFERACIAAQADVHDGTRPAGDPRRHARGIEAPGFVDVREDDGQVLREDGVVRRDERDRCADNLVAGAPASALLQDADGQEQAGGRRVEKMSMGMAGVRTPSILKFKGLEPETRPSRFQTLTQLGQAFFHVKSWSQHPQRWHRRVRLSHSHPLKSPQRLFWLGLRYYPRTHRVRSRIGGLATMVFDHNK